MTVATENASVTVAGARSANTCRAFAKFELQTLNNGTPISLLNRSVRRHFQSLDRQDGLRWLLAIIRQGNHFKSSALSLFPSRQGVKPCIKQTQKHKGRGCANYKCHERNHEHQEPVERGRTHPRQETAEPFLKKESGNETDHSTQNASRKQRPGPALHGNILFNP
jgi:hypothetical protein